MCLPIDFDAKLYGIAVKIENVRAGGMLLPEA
jgi:hypothetical protein